jgi:Phosphatidylserine decarboxylase
MAQVSSVCLIVKPGDDIKKRDDFGRFKFGGSDIVTVFQAKAGLLPDRGLFNTEVSVDEDGKTLPYTFYGSSLVKNPLPVA